MAAVTIHLEGSFLTSTLDYIFSWKRNSLNAHVCNKSHIYRSPSVLFCETNENKFPQNSYLPLFRLSSRNKQLL